MSEIKKDLTLSSLRIDPTSDNSSIMALDVEGPVSMTKTLDVTGAVSVTGTLTATGGTKNPVTLVSDAANDTTITNLVSGHTVFFGTTTGVIGAADGNNAFTFRLPTPTQGGEVIHLYAVNAAAYAKLLGLSVEDPSTTTISYVVREAGALIETASTETGADGTDNTMVKIANTHFKMGDHITCISVNTTKWYVEIDGNNGLLAGGDIAVDPGNAGGYID